VDVSHWPRGGGPYTKAAPRRHKDSPRERERNLRYSTRDPDHRLLFYIKYKNRNGKERHHRKVFPLDSDWTGTAAKKAKERKGMGQSPRVLGTTLVGIHHLTKSKESTLFLLLLVFHLLLLLLSLFMSTEKKKRAALTVSMSRGIR
jgi:hypothetical protein